jgi:hypothetical protein
MRSSQYFRGDLHVRFTVVQNSYMMPCASIGRDMKAIRIRVDKHLSLCAALLLGAISLFAAGGVVLLFPAHAAFCVIPLGIAGLAFTLGSSHAH